MMPIALFKKILAEIEETDCAVQLCLMLQNEPFLDDRLKEWIGLASECSHIDDVAVVTNGSRLTPELLEDLQLFAKLRLSVSINATGRTEYRDIHGRDFWDRINASLLAARIDRSRINVTAVASASDMRGSQGLLETWNGYGFSAKLIPRANRAGYFELGGDGDSTYGHCTYPLTTLSALYDGSVLLCCQDWQHAKSYGNLQDISISEIWNSRELTEIRKSAVSGELRAQALCSRCDTPMSSAERVSIAASIDVNVPRPVTLRGNRTVIHPSKLRSPSGEVTTVVVGLIASAERRIVLFADSMDCLKSGPCELLLPISQVPDALSIDGFEDVWCSGSIDYNRPLAGPGIEAFEFVVAEDDHQVPLLRWYERDWQSSDSDHFVGICS